MSPVSSTGGSGGRKLSAHSAWAQLKQDVAHKAPKSLKQSAAYRAKARSIRYVRHRIG